MQPVFMKSEREEILERLCMATSWRTETNRGEADVGLEGWAGGDEIQGIQM